MARGKPWKISAELWAAIEPLLPRHERRSPPPLGAVSTTARHGRASCSCFNRHPVGILAPGVGIRVRAYVLATDARVAPGRCAAGPAGPSRRVTAAASARTSPLLVRSMRSWLLRFPVRR